MSAFEKWKNSLNKVAERGTELRKQAIENAQNLAETGSKIASEAYEDVSKNFLKESMLTHDYSHLYENDTSVKSLYNMASVELEQLNEIISSRSLDKATGSIEDETMDVIIYLMALIRFKNPKLTEEDLNKLFQKRVKTIKR